VRRHRIAPALRLLFLAILPCCAAAPLLIPAALGFAKNLLDAAGKNHERAYVESVEELIRVIVDEVHDTQSGGPQGGDSGSSGEPIPDGGPPDAGPEFAIDASIIRESTGGAVSSVASGEVLRTGDRFKIAARPHQDCFLYVVLIDATGFVQPLRPGLGGGSQAFSRAGSDVELPAGTRWYELDKTLGVDTVYVVACRERSDRIEQALAQFSSQSRPRTAIRANVTEAPVIPSGYRRRGKTARRAVVGTRSGGAQVELETFFANAGADMVITLWFEHAAAADHSTTR